VLAEAAERMLTAVRTADVACRVGGDEFAVILPESGREDAELLAARIARAVSSQPIAEAGTLHLSAGIAELRQSDKPNDIFERADEALYRAKGAGKGQAAADGA
jgi:diguanylate cyclase (GGDEF)-like protein